MTADSKIKLLKTYIKNLLHRVWLLFLLLKFMTGRRQKILLFGYPIHSNMGDQAQAYCIEKWLKENYPDYSVLKFHWKNSQKSTLKMLARLTKPGDLIFGHSGYFMIDHHKELPVYEAVASTFKKNKCIILPQTINLKSEKIIKSVSEAFNSHPDLTLMCRDKISYEKARHLFFKCHLMLYPDIVTSMIGRHQFDTSKAGILLCVRNDIEAFYDKASLKKFETQLSEFDKVHVKDTNVNIPFRKIDRHRSRFLFEMLKDFAGYRLVVTDRYHGTIFSLVAHTPVVVLSSADHKLKSGVEWFPENFKSHVCYAENLNEALDKSKKMLEKPPPPLNDSFFYDNYYKHLKEKLS